ERGEGVLIERLGRGRHLTEVEEDRDQARGVRVDPVGEVGERGAGADPDDGRTVAAGNLDAADRRRRLLFELLPLRPLRLASADRTAAGAAERTLRGSAATAATATEAATGTTGTAATATATGAAATSAAAAPAGVRRAGPADARPAGHHPRARALTAGARSRRTRPTRARSTRGVAAGASTRTLAGPGHALTRGERVVPRTGR